MKVKIKSWEAMEKEFGLGEFGNIKCEGEFITKMEKQMPENRIIEIDEDNDWISDFKNTWFISKDMIEEEIK